MLICLQIASVIDTLLKHLLAEDFKLYEIHSILVLNNEVSKSHQ